MEILIGLISAISSEITFVVSFIIVYFIARLLHFLYALIHLQNRYRWISDGILCGGASIFLACYVSTLITKNQGFSELVTILVAIILPLIGEIAYFKYLTKKKKPFLVGRVHLAMKTFPQRAEFSANYHSLTERLILENRGDELKNEETMKLLGQEAYDRAQGSLIYLFVFSFLGYALGLFLVHHFLF
jgi:hypothetical protein